MLCTENLIFPTIKIAKAPGAHLLTAYSLRYRLIRFLTCKVPFLPQWITRGKSLLELILLELTFLIVMITIQKRDSLSSGGLTADVACFMVLFALRNNVLTIVFGISFERAIQYHIFFARLTIVCGLIHAMTNFNTDTAEILLTNEATGITILTLMAASALSYLIKGRNFELFYYFHILSYVTIVVVGFVHGATVLSLSILLWGADVLIRYYLSAHKAEADVTVLAGNILQISFPRTFLYSPGQYCFISVPKLNHYQFHVRNVYLLCTHCVVLSPLCCYHYPCLLCKCGHTYPH